MIKKILGHHPVFDTSHDLDLATASLAGLDVYTERTLQMARPHQSRHSRPSNRLSTNGYQLTFKLSNF